MLTVELRRADVDSDEDDTAFPLLYGGKKEVGVAAGTDVTTTVELVPGTTETGTVFRKSEVEFGHPGQYTVRTPVLSVICVLGGRVTVELWYDVMVEYTGMDAVTVVETAEELELEFVSADVLDKLARR